jgi:hypothetical protein
MPDSLELHAQQPDLSVDDILAAGLNDLLDPHPGASYTDLYGILAQAAGVAEAAGNALKARALGLLTAITSMMLAPTEKAAPFQALARRSDGARSFIPADLTRAQVDLIAQLAGAVNHQLLRARLADLVWLKDRRKGIVFPRMAIDAYRTHPIDFDTWHVSGQAVWHRALGLAISLGGGAENRAVEIETALLAAFDRALGAGNFEPMFYVRPLLAEKRTRSEAPRIAGELERLGRERLAAGRGSDAESFFQEAAQWYERAQLTDKHAEMLALIGASLAAQADAHTSAIARQEFITRAIRAYRDVPGLHRAAHQIEETIAALRDKLAMAGRLALGEMRLIRGPTIDLTEATQQAVRRVQGKTPMSALLAFCTLQPFPNRQRIYQQAQELVGQSIIGRLFGGVTLAGDGRAIARRFGADNGAAAEAAQVAARATKACCELTAMTAYGMIRPALEAMQLESYLTPLDFLHLAANAGFVPRDRVDVVAKGLYAGYSGDYVQAIHILVPQFEHMVRIALQDAGAHTTTHDADGLDMEAGLSTLVQRPQMVDVFGEDLSFTIKSIMCEQEGPNLRNAVAHGMADSSLCEGMHGIYAWWLILHLIVSSFMSDQREAQADAPEVTPPTEEPEQG